MYIYVKRKAPPIAQAGAQSGHRSCQSSMACLSLNILEIVSSTTSTMGFTSFGDSSFQTCLGTTQSCVFSHILYQTHVSFSKTRKVRCNLSNSALNVYITQGQIYVAKMLAQDGPKMLRMGQHFCWPILKYPPNITLTYGAAKRLLKQGPMDMKDSECGGENGPYCVIFGLAEN